MFWPVIHWPLSLTLKPRKIQDLKMRKMGRASLLIFRALSAPTHARDWGSNPKPIVLVFVTISPRRNAKDDLDDDIIEGSRMVE